MRGSPDLLSILASDKDAGVAAVASKAQSYQHDAQSFREASKNAGPGLTESIDGLATTYSIVARELLAVARALKDAS